MNSSAERNDDHPISILNLIEGPEKQIGFVVALKLKNAMDLRETAKLFPDGVVMCNPKLIAGAQHLKEILTQAREYWERREYLARSKSMDLLMRITCKEQISEAIIASGISRTRSLALFGFARDTEQVRELMSMIEDVSGKWENGDELLSISKEKVELLKEFHCLPKWLNKDQVLVALGERSILLSFAK